MRVFNTFCFLLFLSSIAYGQLTGQPKPEKVIYSYLDSNVFIENLFPEDTLYKDLKISFVKKKAIHEAGNSYFNVCKIYNILKEQFKISLTFRQGESTK